MNERLSDVAPLDDESEEDPYLGKIIADKYEMLELVGGGGTGLVYKALQLEGKKIVAVKVLFPQMVLRQDVVNRFKQEASASRLLSHPNIVAVLDFGADRSQPYLVMEFIDGVSASDWVEEQGKLPLAQAVSIMLQACAGIQHAHSRSVVHRDLKPSNLMITFDNEKREQVKVVDFGLAKAFRDESASASKLTKTGDICGSPSYMSPEQCRGIKLDYRTDLFSLGCVFYELINGKPPFYGEDPIEVILRQIEETPQEVQLADVDSNVASKANAVLFRAMAKDREQRYQSIEELQTDIGKIFSKKESIWESPLLKLKVAKLKFLGRSDRLPSKKVLAIAVPVAVIISSVIPLFLLLAPKATKDAFNGPITWQVTQPKASQEKPPERIKFTEFLVSRLEEGAGRDSQPVVNALQERIEYFKRTMQYEQEESDLEKLLRIRKKIDGPTSVPTATAMLELANCLYDQGKYSHARPGYQAAIPIFERTFAKDFEDLAPPLTRSASIDLLFGNVDQATQEYKKALAIMRAHNKTDSRDFAIATSGMAEACKRQGQYDQAAELFEQGAKLWSKFSGVEKQNIIACYVGRGDAVAKMNRWGDAEESYANAINALHAGGESDPARATSIFERLANSQWRSGKIMESIGTKLNSRKSGERQSPGSH